MAHAKLAPSRAGRWGHCPQSTRLEALFPEDTESEASREGTAAHQFMTDGLKGVMHKVGDVASNGVVFTEEMQDAARMCWDHLRSIWTPEVYVESPVVCSEIHRDCWGTPDVVVIDRARRKVHILDEKFGRRYVDEWNNLQLVCYAQGCIETYGLTGDDWSFDLTIIQPRYYAAEPVRTWTIDSRDVAHCVSELSRMAARSEDPNSAAVTGPHCRNCNARQSCETLARVVSWVVDESSSCRVVDLKPDTIGVEITLMRAAMERLKARLDGMEELASSMLRKGQQVNGWQLRAKLGRETWNIPTDDVVTFGKALGADLAKPVEVITPNQARKLLGANAAVVDQLASKPPRGHELAPITEQAVAKAFRR